MREKIFAVDISYAYAVSFTGKIILYSSRSNSNKWMLLQKLFKQKERKCQRYFNGCRDGNEFSIQHRSCVACSSIRIRKTNFHSTVVNGNAQICSTDILEKETSKHTVAASLVDSFFRQVQKMRTKLYLIVIEGEDKK
jgi:hypothetical protein